MALVCSCGAKLPDNARFCHHCGKPQREEDLAPAEPEPVPASLSPPVQLIHFGNPVAARVGLLCASLSALLNAIPFLNLGCCLWVIGAGFLSAFLYSRRTGLSLSVSEGARMGWITGLLTFAIGFSLTALSFLAARADGGLRELIRRSAERLPRQDAVTRQMVEFLTSPAGLAIFLITYIATSLLVTLSLAIAGGALGAKVMEKE